VPHGLDEQQAANLPFLVQNAGNGFWAQPPKATTNVTSFINAAQNAAISAIVKQFKLNWTGAKENKIETGILCVGGGAGYGLTYLFTQGKMRAPNLSGQIYKFKQAPLSNTEVTLSGSIGLPNGTGPSTVASISAALGIPGTPTNLSLTLSYIRDNVGKSEINMLSAYLSFALNF
jgi:hypothetical protein